ncbi:G-protein alpha subunit-domain-containing protein [Xylaria telfairii]|nr:G-protein alpha subunit-domain-containing protein [Xylaria telfairii]
MDPASIVQIVGTALSLGDVVIKCLAGLRSLKNKYHDAPLFISTIIGQLYMVQSALDQLAIWSKPEHGRDPRYRQLAYQIDNALDCFSLLVTTLERRLDDFRLISSNDMTTAQRLTFLWGEKETSDFSLLLDRQVNALNLLLQAVQCNTLAQQQDLLLREESQSILQQAKDCSSSIIGLEDSASFISENTAGISLMFNFDTVLLTSRIYQQVGRSHLRQAIRAQNYVPAPSQEQPEYRSEKTEPINQLNRRNLQLQITRKPSNQARILRLVNLRRKTPEQKTPEPSTPEPKTPGLNITRPITTTGSLPKFLILGTSESGKSTLLKGLRLALEGGYTLQEKMSVKEIIWSNVLTSFRLILETMITLEIPLGDQRQGIHVQTIFMQPDTADITPNLEVVEAIQALWLDRGFKEAYRRRNEYLLMDNVAYYVQEIQRLIAPNYVPTDEDLLWASWKTIGIAETCFSDSTLLQGLKCTFLDVGGTRSERRKWVHGFSNTSVVLFTLDTTAYAKALSEDNTVNRMLEQLKLFSSIVNSTWFSRRGVFVLIFTKMDLIEEWLQREPVGKYFPDYPYGTPTAGTIGRYIQYLTDQSLSQAGSEELIGRIRIVQGDLVHGYKDTIAKISEAVNDLAAKYPDLTSRWAEKSNHIP